MTDGHPPPQRPRRPPPIRMMTPLSPWRLCRPFTPHPPLHSAPSRMITAGRYIVLVSGDELSACLQQRKMGVGGWGKSLLVLRQIMAHATYQRQRGGGLLHSAGAVCACMLGSASGRLDRGNTEEAAQFFLSSNQAAGAGCRRELDSMLMGHRWVGFKGGGGMQRRRYCAAGGSWIQCRRDTGGCAKLLSARVECVGSMQGKSEGVNLIPCKQANQ